MKKKLTNLFKAISTDQLDNLAAGFYQPNNKIFTTADLWNIQRQGKCRVQRRVFA